MSWYCDAAKDNPIHETYHDQEYGFPLAGKNARDDERYLFELQSLELFQAGLSWELILKKRPTTVMAFDNFDVDRVAAYKARDVKRLLNDPGIIRSRTQGHKNFFTRMNADTGSANDIFEGALINHLWTPLAPKISGIVAHQASAS